MQPDPLPRSGTLALRGSLSWIAATCLAVATLTPAPSRSEAETPSAPAATNLTAGAKPAGPATAVIPPRRTTPYENPRPPIPFRPRAGEKLPDPSPGVTLRPIGPGTYLLGQVRFQPALREVSFPVGVNMTNGALEYLLVTSRGKTHESVLRTDAIPMQIHSAMLLLGVKGSKANAGTLLPQSTQPPAPAAGESKKGPAPTINPARETPDGDPVTVELRWEVDGREVRRPAGELVLNTQSGSTLATGTWIYNGSRVSGSRFVADLEGSIIALVTDPTAQINNGGAGHDNDRIWQVNSKALPPAGVPLELVLRIDPPAAPAAK